MERREEMHDASWWIVRIFVVLAGMGAFALGIIAVLTSRQQQGTSSFPVNNTSSSGTSSIEL